jgi:hypothetical protein
MLASRPKRPSRTSTPPARRPRRRATTPRGSKNSWTRAGVLRAALLAAPLLTALQVATDAGADLVGAAVFVAAWTAFAAIWIGIAWLDLRHESSRGQAAFAVGIAAIVVAILFTIFGGLIVLPALCLIPLAASLGTRVRLIVSVTVLAAACLLYVAVLFA